MEKKPFLTEAMAQQIIEDVPTPFHVYDEKGIRENVRRINKAFSWNKGFREYFAVKALPNPVILQILKEEGCGVDCSSLTELMLSEVCGFSGSDIMFSSNQTPVEDMKKAYELGAYINLDDATMVDFLDRVAGVPENIFCRYNPGGTFQLGESKEGFQVMDKPGDAKYGMTEEQMIDSYKKLAAKGAKNFGIHAFLASNTISDAYYPELAGILFQLAVRVQKATGVHIAYINLSGGVGIPYRPEQTENDIIAIGEGVRKKFEEILVPAGMGDVSIFTEMGRFTTGPYGALVATAIHEKHIYKEYIGLDACAANLMRPAMYGAYHHITIPGKEASIFIGDHIPVQTEKHDSSGSYTATEYLDAGIKLQYAPIISEDGKMVTASVHTEVSMPVLISELKNYRITSRTADTNVRMYSGETLVIGGLISEEQQRTMQKVPFLSKIPLLGELFKNRSRSHSKTEVLLLLTPHITEAGSSPAIYNDGLMKEEGK